MTRRRGALLLLGAAWVAHGLTIWHNPGPKVIDQAIIFEGWPLPLRITIWLFCGLATLLLAAGGGRRAEALGWALAIIPPTIRCLSYLWSVLMWLVPGAPGGEPLSLAYVIWWTALVGLVWWVSRWPEPANPAAPKRRERRCQKVS